MPASRPRRLLAARVGHALAVLAAVGLLLLSLSTLHDGFRQQAQLDRAYALMEASSQLSVPLRSGVEREARERTQVLFERSELGFSFLALRDREGRVLASFGRFENLPLGFLSAQARGQWRDRLYRLTSDTGETPIVDEGERLGSLSYAHAPGMRVVVESTATQRLRWVGVGGALLSLMLLAGLWMVLRELRDSPRTEHLRARIESPLATAPVGDRWGETWVRLADSLGVACIVTDADARVLSLNGTAQQLCGWPAADAEGRLAYSVFHALDPVTGRPVPATAEVALERNAVVPFALYRLKPRAGRDFPVEAAAAVLTGDDGRPQGAVMLFRDHSAAAAVLNRVEGERRLFERLLDGLDVAVLTLDVYGRVAFANAAARGLFGYAEGRMTGMGLAKLMPVPFLNQPAVRLEHYLQSDGPALPRVVGWRLDATTFPVDLRVQPLQGGEGGYLLEVSDLGGRIRQENRLHRLEALFEQSVDEAYVFDAQTLFFIEINAAAQAALGYPEARWRRMTPLTLAPDLSPETLQAHLSALRGGQVERVMLETWHQRADGSRYAVRLRMQYSRDEQPPVFLALGEALST